jgi:hypothetical protein
MREEGLLPLLDTSDMALENVSSNKSRREGVFLFV